MKEKIQNLQVKIGSGISTIIKQVNKGITQINRMCSKTLSISKYAVIFFNLTMIAFFILTANVNPSNQFQDEIVMINKILLVITTLTGLLAGTYNLVPEMLNAFGKAFNGALRLLAGGLSMCCLDGYGMVLIFMGYFECVIWVCVFVACLGGILIFPAPVVWYYIWKRHRENKQLEKYNEFVS